jgi:prepilin-type N-terminal cleavage/methylation domain-containing protein
MQEGNMRVTVLKGKQGFTLIEILIVTLILGIIMSAVYSVYLTHQKSAYTQEDVVDVQQNLRIAMDTISRDVRMAGMLVPSTSAPLASASAADTITINTASSLGVYAMIDANQTANAGDSSVTFTVNSQDDIDLFKANQGNPVRILRPSNCSQPINTEFTFPAPTDADRTNRQLTLETTTAFATTETIKRGDMIVMTSSTPPAFDSVVYTLVNGGTNVNGITCPQGQQCITRTRITNGTSDEDIIANDISGLNFGYILDNGTETSAPAAANMSNIRAVRVTITGQTSFTKNLSGGPKTRQLSTVIKIRNRRL